jgi:hypothetical protein
MTCDLQCHFTKPSSSISFCVLILLLVRTHMSGQPACSSSATIVMTSPTLFHKPNLITSNLLVPITRHAINRDQHALDQQINNSVMLRDPCSALVRRFGDEVIPCRRGAKVKPWFVDFSVLNETGSLEDGTCCASGPWEDVDTNIGTGRESLLRKNSTLLVSRKGITSCKRCLAPPIVKAGRSR